MLDGKLKMPWRNNAVQQASMTADETRALDPLTESKPRHGYGSTALTIALMVLIAGNLLLISFLWDNEVQERAGAESNAVEIAEDVSTVCDEDGEEFGELCTRAEEVKRDPTTPIPGEPGVPGAAGASGAQGGRGATGLTGRQGDQGETITGPRGQQGGKGDRGDPGDSVTGPTGLPGSPGTPGDPGGAGQKGDKGEPGKDGTNGTNGTDGKDGEPGSPGTNGDPGKPPESWTFEMLGQPYSCQREPAFDPDTPRYECTPS